MGLEAWLAEAVEKRKALITDPPCHAHDPESSFDAAHGTRLQRRKRGNDCRDEWWGEAFDAKGRVVHRTSAHSGETGALVAELELAKWEMDNADRGAIEQRGTR